MRLFQRISKLAIICAVAVAGFLAPIKGNAVTLAGNPTFVFNGNASSSFEFPNQIGAENFVLSQSATVNELSLTLLRQFPDALPFVLNSINWYLYADSNPASGVFGLPSSTLASGITSSFSTTFLASSGNTTTTPDLNAWYKVTFSIPGVPLGPGDYWVGFHVNDTATAWGFWPKATTGDGLNALFNGTSWVTPYYSQATNTVFEVHGDYNAVPIPAALPLFATGLGMMGLLGWRRKRKATTAT